MISFLMKALPKVDTGYQGPTEIKTLNAAGEVTDNICSKTIVNKYIKTWHSKEQTRIIILVSQ